MIMINFETGNDCIVKEAQKRMMLILIYSRPKILAESDSREEADAYNAWLEKETTTKLVYNAYWKL